jgi:serine protease Do
MIPMKRSTTVLALLSAILPLPIRAESPAAALHARASAATVEVLVGKRLSGSGWLATEAGLAFTASHVVPDRKAEVAVRLADGRVIGAKVRARDAGHDALLLELAAREGLPPGLPLAGGLPAVNEAVWLFGSPVFRHRLCLPGTIADAGMTFEWLGEQGEAVECIHVAASTPKGVSGGPWVSARGEVVGIQSGLVQPDGAPAGFGWLSPAPGLAGLLQSKADRPPSTLGVAFEELEEQPAKTILAFPPDAAGIVLKVIVKGGPAEAAKLPAGALAVSIDAQCPTTRDAAYRLVRALPAGKPVEIVYLTSGDGARKRAAVVIAPWAEAR